MTFNASLNSTWIAVLTWDNEDIFQGKQYAIGGFMVNKQDAALICFENNATLANPISENQDYFLTQHFLSTLPR